MKRKLLLVIPVIVAIVAVMWLPAPVWAGTLARTTTNNYEATFGDAKVHVGSATTSFTPVIRFNKWNLESYVELNLIGGGSTTRFTTSTISNGLVTADNTYFTLTYGSVGLKPPYNDIGGIDMKMVLKRNPGLNVVTFTYNHQACVGYLQPPLTPEEIAEGAVRPDYVVNSIAFYHDTKGGIVKAGEPYKTGKIGHLYRMTVTDSSVVPKTTWADWGFGGGQSQITLTVPQTFIDTATYPVTIAPVGDTFGFTTMGGSESSGMQGSIRTSGDAITGAAGTATSMSLAVYDVVDNPGNFYLGIYLNSNNSLVGTTAQATVPLNTCDYITANFASPPSISAVGYKLSFETKTSTVRVYYDATAANDRLRVAHTYGTAWPDPVSSWTATSGQKWTFSIYVTYTPGGGATPPTVTTGGTTCIMPQYVIVSGNVTATGGASVTSWGVYVGFDTSYGTTITNNGTQAAAFGWADQINGLQENAVYHYKAWATNSAGTDNGTDQTFTTGFTPRVEIR